MAQYKEIVEYKEVKDVKGINDDFFKYILGKYGVNNESPESGAFYCRELLENTIVCKYEDGELIRYLKEDFDHETFLSVFDTFEEASSYAKNEAFLIKVEKDNKKELEVKVKRFFFF